MLLLALLYIRANFKWEAQMNIDAEYQEEQGQFHPMIHTLLPGCPAMLSIGGGISVTSNYRKQLIGAYVEPNYIEYLLQYKFGWSNDTITGIAWKS